jgi:hypothetical protein
MGIVGSAASSCTGQWVACPCRAGQKVGCATNAMSLSHALAILYMLVTRRSQQRAMQGLQCCSACFCGGRQSQGAPPAGPALARREAELLMMLDHPGIVECYDVVDDGHQMVIIMVGPAKALLPLPQPYSRLPPAGRRPDAWAAICSLSGRGPVPTAGWLA